MTNSTDKLLKDMEAVRKIAVIPTMLDVICQTTGMGFAAVARVTADRWLACSVRDEVNFGLKAGDELIIETTLCNEVKNLRQPIVIDNFEEDAHYVKHITPKTYGLKSYISYPIFLKNGEFFGTLCAISSEPAQVNNSKIKGMFSMFAELLAFHLQSQDLLERSYEATHDLHKKNQELKNVNFDLDSFVYTASHDLKSPVSNIEGLLDILTNAVARKDMDREEIDQIIGMMKSSLKQFAITINDLTSIVEADKNSRDDETETIAISEIIETVKQDLNKHIEEAGAKLYLNYVDDLQIHFSKKNLKSILYNLLSNAIKYRSPDRQPQVHVNISEVDGKIYLSVTDNGLGIPHDMQDKVFTMFNRFHDHVEGSGIGLYIVKRIVDNVKGDIRVKSTLGEGTTFSLIL